jgi:hypothetical protein
MLVLDSDIFLLDYRYQRDANYPANRRFLNELHTAGVPRATTLFNVLEICGVLSFNLNSQQLRAFYASFGTQYGVTVLAPVLPERAGTRMIDMLAGRTVGVIMRQVSFGDALALMTAESHPTTAAFITWNARHFVGKSRLEALTPREWLLRRGIIV